MSPKSMVDLLRALAEQGEPSRADEREALALMLEILTRMEAQQKDFVNRCLTLLAQQGRKP